MVSEDLEIDEQGRQVSRIAAGKKGWSYIAHPFEFETSKFSSLYSKKYDNTDRNDVTIKFYDSNNDEVTTPGLSNVNEETIVKTVITWKPNYDYELIAGSVRQNAQATSDIRLWVLGGILELGSSYIKEFAGGLNLRYIGANEELKTDGRASKYMKKDITGISYQGNQIQLIVKHDAGVHHKIMLVLEYFRE